MNFSDPAISMDRGISGTATLMCKKFSNSNPSPVKIVKEESNDLAYKIALIFTGIKNNSPSWSISINDRPIDELNFNNSNAFCFKPVGNIAIEVQETDPKQTETSWINISGEKYTVSSTPPTLSTTASDKIKALIEKGKLFKPADDKEVKKIFYFQDMVFLYAMDVKKTDDDIYYAEKNSEEFVKCESQLLYQCRCLQGDATFSVKLPKETEKHTLQFPLGTPEEGGHKIEYKWDHYLLSEALLDPVNLPSTNHEDDNDLPGLDSLKLSSSNSEVNSDEIPDLEASEEYEQF